MFDSSSSWIGGPAGVEAGAIALRWAQTQSLATAGVCQPRAGHNRLIVLQPGDAGSGRPFHITRELCGESKHHWHLRGLAGAFDGRGS